MSRSLLQTVNASTQAISVDGIVDLGSTVRRFGCNCRLNGNAIELDGDGYYTVDATVSIAPTAAGTVSVAVVANGTQVPGTLTVGAVSTAGNPITLPIIATFRLGCCDTKSFNIVLLSGAGTISNVSVRVEKV